MLSAIEICLSTMSKTHRKEKGRGARKGRYGSDKILKERTHMLRCGVKQPHQAPHPEEEANEHIHEWVKAFSLVSLPQCTRGNRKKGENSHP